LNDDRPILRIESGSDFLELDATIEEEPTLQSLGDAYVTVIVQAGGFGGRNDLWVQREQIEEFVAQLAALDRNLSGEARLSAPSPDELELVVRAVTSRGHVALCGTTRYFIQRENGRYWHAVSFGFEFEPSQIATALRHSWLSRYASDESPATLRG